MRFQRSACPFIGVTGALLIDMTLFAGVAHIIEGNESNVTGNGWLRHCRAIKAIRASHLPHQCSGDTVGQALTVSAVGITFPSGIGFGIRKI